jgi:hypothetical protein
VPDAFERLEAGAEPADVIADQPADEVELIETLREDIAGLRADIAELRRELKAKRGAL